MNKPLLTAILISLSSLTTISCGPDQKISTTSNMAIKKYAASTTLEGSVSNNQGIIKDGAVQATDEQGHIIGQANVEHGQYRLVIPEGTALPLLLKFTAESTDEPLIAAVIHTNINKYEINPLSTAIAKTAKAMGGYTHANMIRAAENTVHIPDGNKTTAGWKGDPTTQYGGWH